MTRIVGEGQRKVQLDEFSLPLAHRAKLRVEHGDRDIGQLHTVIRHAGWFLADFSLYDGVVDDETAALIKPGIPVSVGIDILRSEVDPVTGIEHILEGRPTEVSIVREPMIPGAKIIHRWETSAPDFASSASTSPPRAVSSTRADVDGDVFYGGPVIRRYFETPITIR